MSPFNIDCFVLCAVNVSVVWASPFYDDSLHPGQLSQKLFHGLDQMVHLAWHHIKGVKYRFTLQDGTWDFS